MMEFPMRLIKQSIVALTALSLLAPSLSFAQEANTGAPSGFCARVTNVRSEINSKFTDLERKRGEKRDDISDKLKERKDDREDKIIAKQQETKVKFEDKLNELDAEATTDAQKAAIAEFKASVSAAQTVRKATVAAAMLAFRTARDQLITKRQETIRTAAVTFKTTSQAAIEKARVDCIAGADQATVRTTFLASLKTANQKFHEDVKAVDKIGQDIKALAQTRNTAVKAASKTFKDAVQAAKAKLKVALGSS